MEFRNVVFNAARDGKLRRLKVFLDHRPREEVQQLVSARTNGATPLVLAARNGHRDVVEYLIERCSADVEQPGSVTFDGETIEGAPPLWCAAAAGHSTIVRLLTERGGANVNSTTKTNSTPLRAACFDGHYEIVQYLVELGADIEVANRHGHTCLMIACYKGHFKIAKYLIDIGADVNRKSVKGNTALHDCAESGSLDIMKLLLLSGAKMDNDAYGMTPLLAASVTGHMHIVEFLISNVDLVSREEKINALELLGATFVDKKRDMLGCYKLWKRAMEERYDADGRLLVPKQVLASPISAYENTVEVETLEQLQDIISDPDEMRMQALLVRERILGPAHPDTSYYIRYRGAVYADMGHFERCITLWMYALDMQQKMLEPLSAMTQSSLLSFAELFSFMMSESRFRSAANNQQNQAPANIQQHQMRNDNSPPSSPNNQRRNGEDNNDNNNVNNSSNNPPQPQRPQVNNSRRTPVNFCDIMTVFEKAVREVQMGQQLVLRNAESSTNMMDTSSPNGGGKSSLHDRDVMCFNRTLIIVLHLICLLTRLMTFLTPEQVFEVKKRVFEFLRLDPRGRNGNTPLHLACSRDSSSVGRYPICQFPNLDAIRLLLECGANPAAVNADGWTPLHVAAATNRPVKSAVIRTLLEGGCHFDAVNGDRRTFGELLKGQALHEVVNPLKHTTLQCLAARKLKENGRFFASMTLLTLYADLPSDIRQFIDIH